MFSILIHIYLSCVYRLFLLFNFFTSSPSKFWSVISFNCTLLPFAFSSERVSSLCLYFPLNMIITWVLRKIFALCIRHSFWLCVNLVHRIRSFIAFYYIYISVKTRVWHSTNYRKTHSNSILSLEKWRNIVHKKPFGTKRVTFFRNISLFVGFAEIQSVKNLCIESNFPGHFPDELATHLQIQTHVHVFIMLSNILFPLCCHLWCNRAYFWPLVWFNFL